MLTLLGAPRVGLFALLNEECVFPRGTDGSFLAKLLKTYKPPADGRPPRLREVRGGAGAGAGGGGGGGGGAGFVVVHYAGEVRYSVEQFLLKNKDPLSEDLLVLMRGSSEPLVASLFSQPPPPGASSALGAAGKAAGAAGGGVHGGGGGGLLPRRGGGFRGVALSFVAQLDELLRVVGASQPHFVRGVKPNPALIVPLIAS